MSEPLTEHIDTADEVSETRAPEVQALTAGLLRRSLAKIKNAADETVLPWHERLKKTPRGFDFDLRGSRPNTLEKLKRTSEHLTNSVPNADDAKLQENLSHLAQPLEMLRAYRSAPASPEEEHFLTGYGPQLDAISRDLAVAARALRVLADVAVRAAADLDPHSVSRILERKRDLGDATLRRIEDKIATTRSRKEKKHFQEMRDDMRNWLANRDARLESVQPLVDELALRADALRKACLVQSRRLTRAAEMTARVAGNGNSGTNVSERTQMAREAMEFAACLRALLLAARVDATAPLEQS
jgi:hypothetical protein